MMLFLVAVVSAVAGVCVGVMVGGFVAGAAQPCRHCGEDVPYKLPANEDVMIREALGQ